MTYSSLGSITSATTSIIDIIEDPALPRIIYSIQQLHQVEQKRPSTSERKPSGEVPGIGLGKLVSPLQVFIFIRKNPIVGYSLIAGSIFAIMYVGALVFGR